MHPMKVWEKVRNAYSRFVALRPQDLGWWYLLIIFLVSLAASLFRAFTPRSIHIPVGAGLLLLVLLALAHNRFRMWRSRPGTGEAEVSGERKP